MWHKSERRRILMVLESNYPTEGGGGAEGQLRTICRYLKAHGVPVRVFVPMRPDGAQTEHDSVDGVDVWRIPYPKMKKIGGVVLLFRLAVALFRQRREYEVIHAHMAHNMAVTSNVMGWLLGKTVIVKITGLLEMEQGVLDPAAGTPGMKLKRFLLRRATHFQATSSEIRDRLVSYGIPPSRVHVIPNAVDTSRFVELGDASRKSSKDPLTAVYIGRLSAEKALDVMLEAWMDAFPADAAVRLLLVGDGDLRVPMEKAIARAGREDQIVLYGPQADVTPFLDRADFAVLPSLNEGLSNALLEYMASGLPVLGTKISGTVDFIEPDRCGWLVDPGDRNQLAGALRAVSRLDRSRLREMGERARQKVTARARIDIVMAQLVGLYEIDAALLKPLPQKSNVT